MFIGYLSIKIFIPHSRSLKMRRQVIESVKQKTRNNFNVAVAEEPSDKWQTCKLSFVCVNYTKAYVHTAIEHIENFIRLNNDIHILEAEREIL